MSEPVRCGIPFAPGVLAAEAGWILLDQDGHAREHQATALARWPDGSTKWLLLEFAAPAGAEKSSWWLQPSGGSGAALAPLAEVSGATVRLRSADAIVTVRPGDAIEIVRGGRREATIRVACTDGNRGTYTLAITSVTLEWNGTQRAAALACGTIRLGTSLLNVALRISTCAASSRITADLTVHNPRRAQHTGNFWELGDPGSVLFKSLELVLERESRSEEPGVAFSDTPGQWYSSHSPVCIYQESGGGTNWDSRVHVDRSGAVPMQCAGFVVETPEGVREGGRAQPAVEIGDDERSWAGALLRFWEEFPSSIRVPDVDTIVLELLPGRFPALHELQGGERKTRTCVLAHGRRATVRGVIAAAHTPLVVSVDPEVIGDSAVWPAINAADDPRHRGLLDICLEGPASFAAKRERIDEYGWRNFGDLFADHESAFVQDGKELVSHYNNQYDAVLGFGLQFLRTGNPRWFALMDDLARHVADVDIYHTTQDKAAYNGGMFWHTYHYLDAGKSSHRSYPRAEGVSGGGPAAEQNYNAGLALHYFLTGWIPSRDAAIQLGQWVIDMDDGRRTPFRWLSRSDTGLASASGNPLYHGPGRAGGNSINALLVAFDLASDRRFLDKAEGLIHRCVHPADDIAALNLLDAERRWYYTVFLEAVARYLWCKRERGELDASYDHARRSLLHYARWMRQHEYPYLDKPEILEYPTETWSAQDIRKSDVLAWAALCEQGAERQAFLAASKRFFEDVLTRLPSLPTCGYTRPLVLMLSRGYTYAWAAAHPKLHLAPAPGDISDPPPSRFEPQKVVALRRAKGILFGAVAVGAVLLILLLSALR